MGWFNRFLSRFGVKRREPLPIITFLPDSTSRTLALPPADKSLSRPTYISAKEPELTRTQFVKPNGLSYFVPTAASPDWVYPQYDHIEIEVVADVETYVARAVRAKLSLLFREGYSFVGPNDERVEYIRTRFRQIGRASALPLHILLQQTGKDLILHHNAYWLKVRNQKASGGGLRKHGTKTLKPVAGYFPLPPETMVPKVDSSGTIIGWKQSIGGEEKIFQLEDIVHFFVNRKAGYPLGVPALVPVMDDIRSLRSIEANVGILIHKHLFPLVVWKVGTEALPAQKYADGTSEMDVVRDAVAAMPTEGSLVVPNRLDVDVVGIESKALRVETYLEHFRQRVFAGLDISSIEAGISDSSNRGTAASLSRNIMDVVKLYQLTIQEFLTSVIDELLLESSFDQKTVLDPENHVSLEFAEIDKEAKIAEENHAMDLFLKNGITHQEFRAACGLEPLTEEEEKGLYWNKFGKEEALIKSVDEMSPGGTPSAASGASASVAAKNKPSNQHGTRPGPKVKKDFLTLWDKVDRPSRNAGTNPILRWHNAIRDELQKRWASGEYKEDMAKLDIFSAYDLARRDLLEHLKTTIRKNYGDPISIHGLYGEAEQRSKKYVERLRNDLVSRLKLELSRGNSPNIAFAALEYRTVLIYDNESAFFDNLSFFKERRRNHQDVRVVAAEDSCELCKSKLTIITSDDNLGEERLPPFHPLCRCKVVAYKKEEQ